MKNKDIILIMALFILFVVLIFATPFLDNRTSSSIWMVFFIITGIIVLVWIISSISKNGGIIEAYKNQHKVLQILDIAFIILLAYEIIIMQDLKITWLLLFLIIILPWFLKKEEE